MFKPSDMSAAESAFIRVYIAALRRRYTDLKSVMHLMHPDNLAVARFVDASRIVNELGDMHKDFDLRLSSVQQRLKMPYKSPPSNRPTADELADMVMLSFFKVVGVLNNKHGLLPNSGQGWFSGKPNEWHKFLNNLLKTTATAKDPLPNDLMTKCMKAFSDLFYYPSGQKKKWKLYPPNSDDKYADYEDGYLDDDGVDEPENPFW